MRAAAWASPRAGNRASSFVSPQCVDGAKAPEPRNTPLVLRQGHVTNGLVPSIARCLTGRNAPQGVFLEASLVGERTPISLGNVSGQEPDWSAGGICSAAGLVRSMRST